ncbi:MULTISPECIES: LysE family translocator [unclassified Achromobacter]|uniref:LysE family translocator n=1 Tax=unclassified Achromobacter TaxID=2626865 RepID=UPI000B519419|nr:MULTISPECIES: LysE family transporter [unclassified Achromobacter]OWT70299.1 multidrug transporter MatE [Achromobacter sp. HZ34]OWT71839.1 multidrug transporter MatE [Achromobacter sp. HZ28]
MFSYSNALLLAFGIMVVLIMPGPTNTLLAAAGLRQGVRRAARLTAAELAGYTVAITVWGVFLVQASRQLPWLPAVTRVVCGVYVAWLAVNMWRSAVALPSAERREIGLRTLFVATLLNPKAALFAGTIFPPVAFAALPAYLAAMGIFAALLLPIGLLWIAFGAQLGSGRLPWLNPAHVQRGASVVLGAFSATLAWAALH